MANPNPAAGRIVGGAEVNPQHKLPYQAYVQVSIDMYENHFTMIQWSKIKLLTAQPFLGTSWPDFFKQTLLYTTHHARHCTKAECLIWYKHLKSCTFKTLIFIHKRLNLSCVVQNHGMLELEP